MTGPIDGAIAARGRVRPATIAASVVFVALVALVGCVPRPSVELGSNGQQYGISVEHNLEITISDGRIVRGDLYRPADPETGTVAQGEFPVIVGLTPYGKSLGVEGTGTGGINLDLVRAGYIAAVLDVPGTGVSDGAFALFSPQESDATVEVINWAGGLEGSNGKVGMIGHSYSAINQLFAAAKVGPGSPLKAIFPMSATVDPYRDLFVSGGALNVMSPLGLLFSYGITRSLTPFVEAGGDPVMALHYAQQNFEQMGQFEGAMANDMVSNGSHRYFDDFWSEREPARILQQIADNDVAVFMVGGLYDVFQRGVPLIYSGLQNASVGRDVYAPMTADQSVTSRFQLLFGPWTHGSMGDPDLRIGNDSMTALQQRWFDHWLKGIDNGVGDVANPIRIIEPDGVSYETDRYPLSEATTRRFWFASNGELKATPSDPGASANTVDTIEYQPLGETCSASTVQFAAGLMAEECLKPMMKSQRSQSEVTYSTATLDQAMQLAGPIGLTLSAKSNRPDTFFAVTVEDVAPDGTSMDITGGDQLGSLRQTDPDKTWVTSEGSMIRPYLPLTMGSRTPVPVGDVETYRIEVRPAFATIAAGHKLRVRISTSDFPHVIPLADLWDLIGGVYEIHHDQLNPSYIDIPVRASTARG